MLQLAGQQPRGAWSSTGPAWQQRGLKLQDQGSSSEAISQQAPACLPETGVIGLELWWGDGPHTWLMQMDIFCELVG